MGQNYFLSLDASGNFRRRPPAACANREVEIELLGQSCDPGLVAIGQARVVGAANRGEQSFLERPMSRLQIVLTLLSRANRP